jgi:hypothetical protein
MGSDQRERFRGRGQATYFRVFRRSRFLVFVHQQGGRKSTLDYFQTLWNVRWAEGNPRLRSVRRSVCRSSMLRQLVMAGEMIIPKARAAEDRRTVLSESEPGSFRSRVLSTSQDLVP